MSYNRDVRPILAENCFACHGPDRAARKANLRLDVREEAVARAIAPGKPGESPLIARILETRPALRMPPVASHKTMTAAQKHLLKRWVAEGARYERHWAFGPLPARVPVPPVRDAAWSRNEIDRFVLARLEQEGLRPSPEAGPLIWLRRVTLDLTGLPPTLEEAEAFLRESSSYSSSSSSSNRARVRARARAEPPNSGANRGRGRGRAERPTPNAQRRVPSGWPNAGAAYERVVDRLLASPRFGERMAVPWLDLARYADSYGYQSDQLSPTWPYRDWVVKAFNENLPYDWFLTYQLAGDLLPQATADSRVATAFNRLHRMTAEGGSVPEEWRLEGVADRVNTFGTAVLGMTLECARCHDHKYDPVSQKDYYGLSAFFNSIDEYGLYDRAEIVPTPSLLLPTPEQARELTAAREAAAQAEAALGRACAGREAAFREWLEKPGEPLLADLTGSFDFERFDGTSLPNRAPGAKENGARQDEVPLVEGHTGRAALLDGENNVNFPQLGRFTRHTPFTIAFRVRDAALPGERAGSRAEPAVVFQACSGTDAGPYGYDLLVEQGRLTARMFRHWPGNAIAVRTRTAIPRDAWTHVAVTYDGSSRASGLRIYLEGRPAEVEVVRDRLSKTTGQHTLTFGQRFRDKGFKGGRIDDLSLFNRSLTALEVAQVYNGKTLQEALLRPRDHEAGLREYYLSAVDPEAREAARALAAARARLVAAEDACFEIAVMEEMPQPRPAYVLARGHYDAPKTAENQVDRGVPAAVLPFPAGLRRDRLGLAQWLTRPDHPLTARVAVNRFWSLFLGRGLVETQEDFGTQGRAPTHPALLDYLAGRFAQAWNVKKLVRLIVLSSTYRQASALPPRGHPELARRDPENRLLARGPSQRLSAEAVRDLALAASGLLDGRMGGPPVSPYQPGDLWRESNTMSPPYRQSVGRDLYRRSLYSVVKRTAPMPNVLAFDGVSREVCVARRQVTSTPLQALVLLNDPQFVEAARILGERALSAGPSPAERVRSVFRLVATREPTAAEGRLLVAFYERQRAQFAADPAAAAKLLKVGERKPDPSLPPVEAAAAAALAQAVLNLDAAVWKR